MGKIPPPPPPPNLDVKEWSFIETSRKILEKQKPEENSEPISQGDNFIEDEPDTKESLEKFHSPSP